MTITVTIQKDAVTVIPSPNSITLTIAAGLALSAGMGMDGNSAGTAGIVSGRLDLVGGNNITLSQSLSGQNATLTIIGGAGGGGGGSFSAGVSTGGNTLGSTGTVSNRLVFAGGNNITLSQSTAAAGATITISAANETQTVPPIATNVNAVATAGSTGTVTRFAPEDHRHAGIAQAQISGNTSNTSNVVLGSLVLAGGNNVTLSQVSAAGGATITISAANETQTVPPIATTVQSVATANSVGTVTRFAPEDHRHAGIAQAQISGNTSNTSNVVLGSLVLAGGNNITLSQVSAAGAATITISAANETQTVPPIATAGKQVASARSTGTITRFAPEDHAHEGVAQFQISGNTSNTSNIVLGSLVLAGGNNITLSQVSAAGAATITISGPNVGGAQTGISGIANSQTTYTSGSVTFSELGAITIRSTTGQQFQFSVNAQTSQSNTIGMSNIGNTAGDTAIRSGPGLQVVFAGGNNVTLSQSTNGSSATITISAFNQTSPIVGNAIQSVSSATDSGAATSKFAADDHKHAGVGPFGVSNIGGTSGDTGTQYGRVVLAGGNNITLSVSSSNNGAQTITISAPNLGAGAGYTAGMSNLGNTSGTTGVADSRLVIVGGNNITISQSLDAANHSGTLTISAFNQTVESNTIGMSNIGNTSGDTAIRSAGQLQIVLAGGNGVTLSQSTNGSSATVTVSAGVATLDYWQLFPGITWATIAQGQSTVFVQPLLLPQAVTFDRVLHYISVSQSSSSNSSYSFSLDFHVGIYTKNASTLSLLKSGSAGYGWSITSNNATADQAGIRAVSVPVATLLVPGEYWVALLTIARSTNANWATASNCVYPGGNSAYSGLLNVASNASFQPVLGMGLYSVQTAVLPASIGFAQIQGANTAFFRSTPILNFANGTI